MNKKKLFEITFSFTLLIFSSCTTNLPIQNRVIVHQHGDPSMLNPVNGADAGSDYITNHIFQRLIDVNFKNPEQFIPVLADSLPQVEKTSDGRMFITYKIRK